MKTEARAERLRRLEAHYVSVLRGCLKDRHGSGRTGAAGRDARVFYRGLLRDDVATIRALRLAIEHCGAIEVWAEGDPAAAWREWFAANCGEWNDVKDIEAELRGEATLTLANGVVAKVQP